MPDGHDTVVMQEDVRTGTAGGRPMVAIPAGLKRGANVSKAGEDVKAGETVLAEGAVLRPQDLAALASLGFGEVGLLPAPEGRHRLDRRRGEAGRRRARAAARSTTPTRRCWRR